MENQSTEPQVHILKPGDKMHFHNQGVSPIRITVTAHCGTQTEAELHPGAVLKLVAGSESASVKILPPTEAYTGLKIVT